MRKLKFHAPTNRERAALERIYGSEENWMGVATTNCKHKRAMALSNRRKANG